jgi:hypothetical protein
MTSLTLRYREDTATGLPRLEDPSGSLSAADLDALRRAIERQFDRLAGGPDGQLVALNGPAGAPPRHFRVRVLERGKRCPTLMLEAAAPPLEAEDATVPEEGRPEAVPAAPVRWQGQFVAETAELLADRAGDGGLRSPLRFVLADLRALLRKDPRKLTLLLFAGYLHVGETLSRRHGETGASQYVRAAEALLQRAGDALPDGALAPLVESSGVQSEVAAVAQEEPVGWLRRFFSFC